MIYGIDSGLMVVLIGIGATMLMDDWGMLLKQLKIPTLNFALLGRWVVYVFHGQCFHQSIAKAPPVKGELFLGWVAHYAIGVLFSALFVMIVGLSWLTHPVVMPAIVFGIVTVLAPFLMMQPAMGAGIASSKTATPWKNCIKSLLNHAVFGVGLYLAALTLTWL